MLIDELNECEARVKVAEAVIGDLKNTDLIDTLTRNERMKEAMLQEIEDLQDKSKQLDKDLVKQDKEIEQIDNFINSENGMNQQKVSDLEEQLKIGEENIEHLQEVSISRFYYVAWYFIVNKQQEKSLARAIIIYLETISYQQSCYLSFELFTCLSSNSIFT